jgi:kumamolisin
MSSSTLLFGSHREHPFNAAPAGDPIPNEIIQVTLSLRRRSAVSEPSLLDRPLTHAELAEAHGADPADIAAIEAFAAQSGLSVLSTNVAARSVTLSGPLCIMTSAFGADVRMSKIGDSHIRTRQGHLSLPKQLADVVVGVFGFDERPVAGTNFTVRPRAAAPSYYTPPQLAAIYNFPPNTGKNQTIALIELGGGYNDSDLQSYWQSLGLNNVNVTAVSVDGTQNQPTGDPNGPDGEVVLDIEVAGGVAPDANIAVYFGQNTDQGFLNAINAAIYDTVRKPSVISISWGSAENTWTSQAMNAYNAAFHDASLMGISVCVAAGDNGSTDGQEDKRNHVDFPASSPWVLACGGTRLVANGTAIQSETVWNDGTDGGATGGGVSSHFSKPAYQAHVSVPKPSATSNRTGRGVPDIAAVADPETGYYIFVDGQENVIGGTSAVAPLWAGLIALCNEQLGRNLGWLHPALYGTIQQHKALHDITSGTNGAYKAGIGWDCCTGWGTPNGQAILALLK